MSLTSTTRNKVYSVQSAFFSDCYTYFNNYIIFFQIAPPHPQVSHCPVLAQTFAAA